MKFVISGSMFLNAFGYFISPEKYYLDHCHYISLYIQILLPIVNEVYNVQTIEKWNIIH